MPDKNELWLLYTYYKFAFWFVSVGMLYYCCLQIYDQGAVEIYFIDWEKRRKIQKEEDPSMANQLRANNPPVGTEPIQKQTDITTTGEGSTWRKLLIANEFNEMFGERYISFQYVLLVFGVIMIGFEYQNWAAQTPFLTKDIGVLELNYILKFFFTSIILLFLGCLFYCNKNTFF